MLRLYLSCNQGSLTFSSRCIYIIFAKVCTSVGIMTSITKTYCQKAQEKPQVRWFKGCGMHKLHLNCNQCGRSPSGRCVCNTFTNVCISVGIVASMTKTYYQKNTTHTSNRVVLGFWNAQVTFKLQPRWSHPFWQVYLQYFCTSLHLCKHSGQHNQNILSIKHNPNLNLYDSRVLECSGCI